MDRRWEDERGGEQRIVGWAKLSNELRCFDNAAITTPLCYCVAMPCFSRLLYEQFISSWFCCDRLLVEASTTRIAANINAATTPITNTFAFLKCPLQIVFAMKCLQHLNLSKLESISGPVKYFHHRSSGVARFSFGSSRWRQYCFNPVILQFKISLSINVSIL